MVKTTGGATGRAEVHTKTHYESHRKVYGKLRIVEQILRYLLNIILSMITLFVQSPGSCRYINHIHFYQCNVNLRQPDSERQKTLGEKK